jgi:SAM-dependent methyltransferase
VRGVHRLTGRALGAAHALLDPEVADLLSVRSYERQDAYRDAWHQELGLFDFETAWLDRAGLADGATILLLGAGGGREAIALTRRGFVVTAVERTAAMVEAGRAHPGSGGRWVQADVRALAHEPALRGPYDAVWLGWGLYGHILTADERVALLRAVVERTAGPVLLSWRDAPRRGLVGHAGSTAGVRALREGRAAEARSRLVTNLIGTVCVYLTPAMIAAEAARAGLRVDAVFDAGALGYPCAFLRVEG